MFNKNDFSHPQEISWLGYNRGWVLLSLRVVLYFPQASVGERKRARKFTFCEKRRLAEGREKKGFPYWVLERLLLVRFCFWCGYSSMSVSTLSPFFFFDLLFSPSSSTKGHRKYLPFILFVRWGYLVIKLCKSVLKLCKSLSDSRNGLKAALCAEGSEFDS